MNKDVGLKIALVGLILGVIYSAFVVPMHFEQKLIKSTNLEEKDNEIRH